MSSRISIHLSSDGFITLDVDGEPLPTFVESVLLKANDPKGYPRLEVSMYHAEAMEECEGKADFVRRHGETVAILQAHPHVHLTFLEV